MAGHQSIKAREPLGQWAPVDCQGGHPGFRRALGSADPGLTALGPHFLQRLLAVVPYTFPDVCCSCSLSRGRDGGLEHSNFIPLTHSLSQTLLSEFHWILLKFKCKKPLSLSHFFAARIIPHLEEQLSGKNFHSVSLT
jgi:hypothetical protein